VIPKIDVDRMVAFLVGLLNIPSPTGDTDQAIRYVRDEFAVACRDESLTVEVSPKGALVCTWSGEQDDAPRALTAHVDTLGAMAKEIKSNGRLRLTQLGSWGWTSVEGEGVTIFTSKGIHYRGTILPVAASTHAFTRKERTELRSDANMEVRIDAKTTSAEQTRALGIRVGDVIAFDPRVELSEFGFIRSRHLDDKASVAVVYGALRALVDAGLRPRQRTTIHISNYEEVGHGAAAGFPEDLMDLLVVDMAVVAPKQESNEHTVTICAKDSGGPYHLGLRRQLEDLATKNDLRHCTDVYAHYSSDGTAYWRAGGNVRVGLVGPGVDASHHYERTHRDALENSAGLIAAYLLS
jgi:putative aminopeptidase FrvX